MKTAKQSFAKEPYVCQKAWDDFDNYFIKYRGHISTQYEPLFGEALKTKDEIHEVMTSPNA